jgi:hypothetical protein
MRNKHSFYGRKVGVIALKKKVIVFLSLICLCLCMAGCAPNNKHDTVEIYNKTGIIFDNIKIDTKDGYFYDRHEKFTVDDNTIGITIYFSTTEEDTWDNKVTK